MCPTERKRRNKNNEYYITGQLNCIVVLEPLELKVNVLGWFCLGFSVCFMRALIICL